MKKIYAFIFARGGSKGVIGKNKKIFAGIPLIGHSLELANNLDEVVRVFVSTDCDEIAAISREYGAEIIKRPNYLAMDNSSEWDAWQHAINHVNNNYESFDHFLSLPCTAPLRIDKDVLKCFKALKSNVDIVLTMTKAKRSPWFNMVQKKINGQLKLVNSGIQLNRRQDAPYCYDLTTVAYFAKTEFILKASSLWDGNVFGVEIPEERAIDIDTLLDFEIASFLLERNKLD
ncbi:cytidylyltransferase domain-containing protein [Prochlorococcus sp. MIT 1011]|uniref:acylneuraminate cytidylyltransferase family protein n=1 Tax=Prochlorococcus sp. MIT 1011 TaxID=3082520 RepID=UPI0039B46419